MPNARLLDQLNSSRKEFAVLTSKLNLKLFPEDYHSTINHELNLLLSLSEYFFQFNSFISDTLALELIYWYNKINSFFKSLDYSEKSFIDIPIQVKNYKEFEEIDEELFMILKKEKSKKLRDELLVVGSESLRFRITIDSRIDTFETRLKDNQYKIEEANQNIKKQLSDILKKSKEDSQKIETLKESFTKEINILKDEYKFDISQFELFKQQREFLDTANKSKIGLKYWITSIIGITILLIFLSLIFFDQCWFDIGCLLNKELTQNDQSLLVYFEIIKRILLRLFMFATIIVILKFCIKNYNAAKHNITINLHKANCFGAAFKIIASIEDNNTKQEILKQAGREIFSHHNTGYIINDDSKIDLGLIEKITSIVNKSSN